MPGNFLSEGFQEIRRKLDRSRLRRAIRQKEAERLVALTALGHKAWEEKVDLGAHAAFGQRLSGLDARADELSQTASRLEAEKSALEKRRKEELDAFSARRKAVEEVRSPVDAALREVRARKSAAEQAIRQAEARQAAIAGQLAGLKDEAQRPKLVAEQGELAAKLAASRTELPGTAAEESRLAGESQKHAAHIATIDAEQKAAIGRIDTELARVRTELQGATQQTGAVNKDRAGIHGELGRALYDAGARTGPLAEPAERVAAIDRALAESAAAVEASEVETRGLAGGTMGKFWGVTLGVPIVVAALAFGAVRYLDRSAPPPVVATPSVAPQPKSGACEYQKPPDNGTGVGVGVNCVRSEGTFVKGVLQSGKRTYPDGRVSEGTFVDGQQSGMGTLTWKDGRRYEGMFVEGRSFGPGDFTRADGTRDSGMFRPGVKLNGIGTRTNPDGSMLVGRFIDGQPSPKMALVKDGKTEVVSIDPATRQPGTAATLEVTR